MTFSDYNLPNNVLAALAKRNITDPTPIQSKTLPVSLTGGDIIGQARTGTGKTLAFGLPIASQLDFNKEKGRLPRAIVVAPTRELASQVSRELEWVAPHLTTITIYGGTSYVPQERQLRSGCDVVVATPGRALDYLQKGKLNLAHVEIAVLDEADEMLSMGFKEDVEAILAATPEARQTMVFSATFPKWAKKLVQRHTTDATHANVISGDKISYEEIAIAAPHNVRSNILGDVLHVYMDSVVEKNADDKSDDTAGATIVFTNTKAEVETIRDALNGQGHKAEALHGDLSQSQREDVLARFRKGLLNVLVGTNVAARGLDIPQVDLVVHYRLPHDTANYQHRSGRTGRAGRAGKVIILYGKRETGDLKKLERTLSRNFNKQLPPNTDDVKQAKLARALQTAQKQPDNNKQLWQDLAMELIAGGDVGLLSGILASWLGGAPVARSLLTGEEKTITMQLHSKVHSVGQVLRLLKEAEFNHIGKIQLNAAGALVDLPTDQAKACKNSHFHLVEATQDDLFTVDKKPSGEKSWKNKKGKKSNKRYPKASSKPSGQSSFKRKKSRGEKRPKTKNF